ncbi:MAG: hypothetical protein GKS05_10330 [Nitrospirales bacterium]|nr:hypothetical protein [Nitrospirales bacterium]
MNNGNPLSQNNSRHLTCPWLIQSTTFIMCVLGIPLSWAWGISGDVMSSIEEKRVIEVHAKDGMRTITLPIYKKAGVTYFSAGVGIMEREASYPQFPLKFVFATKEGPYITLVTISIFDQEGTMILTIPSDHATGPWLFVDLQPDTYTVVALRTNGTSVQQKVTVKENESHVVYFHW